MTRLASGRVRQDFSDTINRVAYGGERIVLHRRGKDVAAVIPIDDLTLLEELLYITRDRLFEILIYSDIPDP